MSLSCVVSLPLSLQAFPKYEAFMNRLVTAIDPLLDICPMDVAALTQGSLRQRFRALAGLRALFCAGERQVAQVLPFVICTQISLQWLLCWIT